MKEIKDEDFYYPRPLELGEFISDFQGLDHLGKDSIDQPDLRNRNKRLVYLLDFMKTNMLISSYKEFAENVGENSVGINDIKKEKKMVSDQLLENIVSVYPFVDKEYLKGNNFSHLFKDDFLLRYANPNEEDEWYILNDIKKAKSFLPKREDIEKLEKSGKIKINKKVSSDMKVSKLNEILNQKNEDLINANKSLINAKNEIIDLQKQVHELTIKLMKKE